MAIIRIPPLYDWARNKGAALVKGKRPMKALARWHVYLAWFAGVPILMWTITGLVMVARPIEEVRGEHLRVGAEQMALPAGNPFPISNSLDELAERPVELRTYMQNGNPVTIATYESGRVERYSAATGQRILPLDGDQARALVAEQIIGGDQVVGATFYEADDVPLAFRIPMPVWQVRLADNTHVYVGRDTGEIAAVRTRQWRVFDFMWGLHIMDLQTRKDTSHPILILFTALAVLVSLLGTILMLRKRIGRRKRHKAAAEAEARAAAAEASANA